MRESSSNDRQVYISLGSNLGDRRYSIRSAERQLRAHPSIECVASSSVRETPPHGITDQPMFLNQVVAVRTDLSPEDLLFALHEIEAALGRKRGLPGGPRTIDLDILLYGGTVLRTPRVTIPHPRLRERPFFVSLLLELDPEIRDPETGKKLKGFLDEHMKQCNGDERTSIGTPYRGGE